MFIVELTYIRPLSEIDQDLEAHRKFLDENYAAGKLYASGPKVPREGGIILVNDMSREDLDKMLTQDPFFSKKLANFRVTEVNFTKGRITSQKS